MKQKDSQRGSERMGAVRTIVKKENLAQQLKLNMNYEI